MSATIYLEGGGDSRDLRTRCQEGFHKLLKKCGFAGRMPRLVACGGRQKVFDDFRIAQENKRENSFVAMLIDSEDAMVDLERPWEHLRQRDRWTKPENATDEQVLLMATCMETWIIADRDALRSHYGSELQESALPDLADLENRQRHSIQEALVRATRNCSNAFRKGKRSFEVLAELDPNVLATQCRSFARAIRILRDKL